METSPQVTKYMKTRGRVRRGGGGEIPLYSWFICVTSTAVTLIRFAPMRKLQEVELLPSGRLTSTSLFWE